MMLDIVNIHFKKRLDFLKSNYLFLKNLLNVFLN